MGGGRRSVACTRGIWYFKFKGRSKGELISCAEVDGNRVFSILCKIYKIGDLTCSVYVVPPDIVYG